MIGYIRGILLSKQNNEIVVDVNGIGYEVQVPLLTVFGLAEAGGEVQLFTHMVVREDAQLLYGFDQELGRSLFRLLIKVNGVGPKLALTILSGMSAGEFIHVINRGDAAALVKLPGVGKKTAERLVLEVRDKLKNLNVEQVDMQPAQNSDAYSDQQIMQEAESALIALGYKPVDASKMVNKAADAGIESAEQLIRSALKAMA